MNSFILFISLLLLLDTFVNNSKGVPAIDRVIDGHISRQDFIGHLGNYFIDAGCKEDEKGCCPNIVKCSTAIEHFPENKIILSLEVSAGCEHGKPCGCTNLGRVCTSTDKGF